MTSPDSFPEGPDLEHPDLPDSLAPDDAAAFQQLFEAYFAQLTRFVYRYLGSVEESRDLVHDLFFRIWRERRRIGIARDLRSYLYTAARNLALDRIKHRRVEERWLSRELTLATEADEPSDELEDRELAAAIQQALDTLPPRQREVIRLRWERHLSYQEVADALGISPKTVAIHLTRALRNLREVLPRFLD